MQNEPISHQESLALIESMINKAKNRFSENGFLYLLWGWVILFCSLGQYILQYIVHFPQHYLIWTTTWLALIVQIVYIIRKRKKRRVLTYTEEITRYVWVSFLVLLILLGYFIDNKDQGPYGALTVVGILAIYGMPTFLSGIILRFKPLINGGMCCWGLAIIARYIPEQYHLLMVAAAVTIAWIIPGFLLRARYKLENAGL